jgi:penicillin-binding protein 1C
MLRAYLRLARRRCGRWRRSRGGPSSDLPSGRRRDRARAWSWRACLWTLAAGGCACTLLLLGVAGLAGLRAHFETPPPSRLLLDRDGRFLGELPGTAANADGLGYWPLAELPPRVVTATLALEDRRFGHHPGVDPLAAARAVLQNLRRHGRVSGASTLAMQVARMQSPGARAWLRKATEAVTAVLLTERYGSREVLRQYLRIVPYGNRIHGIAYAARSYFDKPVEDLSWAEIAFLAALPQAPARMNPFSPAGRERAVRRGERVLARLAARGVLSPAEHALARGQLAALRIPWRERRPAAAMHALLHLRTLLAEGKLDAAGVEASGAPDVPILRTTLDLDLQREVSAMTWQALHEWRDRGAGNASLIVVDLGRHEVLAWVGSADYFDADDHGAIDYARVRRSAGSTLKPFLYALALERGVIGPATLMDDVERGPGGVADADDTFLGPLLPRVALANSRNVPAVLLLGRVGLDQGYALFRELGLTDGALPARHYGLGMAIGGLPVTLEQLGRAYLALAGDGRLPARLRWLREGDEPPPRRIFSEDTARQVTLFLSDPQARLPSFPRMGATEYRFPVAVKTGTSTNYHDAWAVAWSRRYLAAAWVGHPGYRAMNQLSGYLSAADLVRRVLLRLSGEQDDGLDDLSFPPPRGHRPVRICALSGHRATAACDRVFLEWFRPGEEPADDCEVHRQRAVDRRNGLLASAATPPAAIEVRTFVDLPARYAAWQAAAGLPRTPIDVSLLTVPAVFATRPAPEAVTAALARNRLRITSPENGARLMRDPETPAELGSVALTAVIDPPVNEVVWYVDGMPFATAPYPYTTRWRLRPGEHTFQLRLGSGGGVSRPVRITVD